MNATERPLGGVERAGAAVRVKLPAQSNGGNRCTERLWLLAGMTLAVLLVAASATATTKVAGSARAADATPAAAPFAQSWANVPRTLAARKAKDILVFGQEQDIVGFNTNLTCCSQFWANVQTVPVIRGAYNIEQQAPAREGPGHRARRRRRRRCRTTIRPDANWNWGGKKIPVTYKDFAYTWQHVRRSEERRHRP